MSNTTNTSTSPKNESNTFIKWIQGFSASVKKNSVEIVANIIRILLLFSRALVGAIVLTFMAELAPGLREKLPYLYEVVDVLLGFIEFIFRRVTEIL